MRDNVLLARPDASEQELQAALDNAWVSEFLPLLPQGVDTPVGDQAARLSVGQAQRVAVARALVHAPKLVIADEPTGNIDPELSLEMMELLEEVSKTGITVLVVTHEHELVHRFHQRVVTLNHGRIVSDVPAAREEAVL